QCRSQQLLAYFGETDAPRCGICDICLGRKKELSNEAYERYREKIKRLLQRDKLSLKDVLDSFGARHQQQVTQTIEYLIDEGFVDKEEEYLIWKG
ncbi:MAG: RecQ family zinc-binding domain-containing protein, partial [Bacteroidota bacterium]